MTERILVVDAANVIGSRPTGWWRDRPGAARTLHRRVEQALKAGLLQPQVVLVLEGKARDGVPEDNEGDLRVVHAPGSGDDAIVALVGRAVSAGDEVTVVSADRELAERTREHDGTVVGPRWLLETLDELPE